MELVLLYSVIAISLIWLAAQYKKNQLALFIILLFASGLFGYLGKDFLNFYKIVTLVYSIYLMLLLKESVFVPISTKLSQIIILFLLFVASFFVSSVIVNHEGLLLTVAQINRFFIPMSLFLIFRKIFLINRNSLHLLNKLFYKLIVLQIVFSVVKIILLGNIETIVGSIASQGGAIATSFPLLALLWLGLNTNMELNRKSMLFLIALLLIGFASGKRAIWVLFPVIFFFYSLYVVKIEKFKNYSFILFLVPLLFYFGVRLTPTLNAEGKLWGSFNVEYVYDYFVMYSFGEENKNGVRESGAGRGGANILLWQMITTEEVSVHTLFGYGSSHVYAADKDLYRDSDYYFGVNHKGSLTGVFQLYIAAGLISILLFLVYYFLMFTQVKYRRLGIMFIIIAVFDFVFYAGTIAREPALSVFFVFMIFYANVKYDSRGSFLLNSNRRSLADD